MKILKILFVSLILFSAFNSNALTINLDKSELIKEMSNNKIVETYVRNILNVTLISAYADISKLPAETKAKIDEKMKLTLEYGKSIELFFPAYGSLSTIEKKEILHTLVQQVSQNNLFSSSNDDCIWSKTKLYAACLGITAASDLILFLGCALVCAAIDAFVIVATGGSLTGGVAVIIAGELAACAAFAANQVNNSYSACKGEFTTALFTCD